MKGLLLTPLAFAAFAIAAQAQEEPQQNDTPTVESVTAPVSDRAQNPDMDELPADDEGLPDMDMEGMRTVDGEAVPEDGDTAPLDEGFVKEVDPADEPYQVQDESMMAPEEADVESTDGEYTDGDADGYDPVVDEVEQGTETAVKATGAAADEVDEEVGEEVGELFEDDTAVEEADVDNPEGDYIDRDADGYDPVVDEVEQGSETAVKATGEAASKVGDEVEETFTDDGAVEEADTDNPEGDYIDRDADGYDPVVDEVEQGAETAVKATGEAASKVGGAVEDGADTFGDEVEETYEEAKELNTRGAASDRPDEDTDSNPNR